MAMLQCGNKSFHLRFRPPSGYLLTMMYVREPSPHMKDFKAT
jgi:hypothetical protein